MLRRWQILAALGFILVLSKHASADEETLRHRRAEDALLGRDYPGALRDYQWLADNGRKPPYPHWASYTLGYMHMKGQGVLQNYEEAVKWFKKSAVGNTHAQHALALMYAQGLGVKKSNIFAHMWANIAASESMGDSQAESANLRDLIEKQMSATDIARAQNLARICAAKKYINCD